MKSIGTLIDENTKIPLFAVIGFFTVFIGGVSWLTSMNSDVRANTEDITEMKIDNRDEMKLLIEIRERIIKLEEKIIR